MTTNSRIISLSLIVVCLLLTCIVGCSDDPETPPEVVLSEVVLSIDGFDSLATGHFEAWVVHQATYTSLGKFNLRFNDDIIDLEGNPITSFETSADLSTASRIAVTLEPENDADGNPSAIELLTGMIEGNAVSLGFKVNYSGRSGNYVIITPSDGGGLAFTPAPDTTNPNCGVWFISKPWGEPEFGMTITAPPEGWRYEGWYMDAMMNWISTGKFDNPNMADDTNLYISDLDTATVNGFYHFPGEDFLANAPAGWDFPLDVHGGMVFVTLEPEPDNSPDAFKWFMLFCHSITADAAANFTHAMDTPPMPTGTATLR